tara:strand:+ start:665 stop:943 length:279 start_codon:yes stop_codon:yes gene_type:complete
MKEWNYDLTFTGVLKTHHHVVQLFKRIQYGDAPFNVTECQWAIATPVVNHQILNILEEPKQISWESWTPRDNGFDRRTLRLARRTNPGDSPH